MSELRATLRRLLKAPFYSLAFVSISSLAIGLTTVTFSVADGALFKALPYRDGARLFAVHGAFDSYPGAQSQVSPRDIRDWNSMVSAARISAFQSLSPLGRMGDSLAPVRAARVDNHLLDLLGVVPELGGFRPSDFVADLGPESVLVTHALWRELFGGRSDAIGSIIELRDTGKSIRIAGVLPAGFVFPDPGLQPDVLLPLRLTPELFGSRVTRILSAVLRIPQGMTQLDMQSRLSAAARRLQSDWPSNAPLSFGPFDSVLLTEMDLFVTGRERQQLAAPVAATGLILFLSCLNLAGLAVDRLRSQHRDMAIRRALGASPSSIITLQIGELSILVGAGALVGVLYVPLVQPLLIRSLPPATFLFKEPGIDYRVLLSAAVFMCATLFIIVGIVAFVAGQRRSRLRLFAGESRSTRVSTAGLDVLVIAQISIGFVLTISGVFIVTGYLRLSHRDLGYEVRNRLVVETSVDVSDVPRVVDELSHVHGVIQATAFEERLLTRTFRADIPWRAPKGSSMLCLGGPKVGIAPHFFDVMQTTILYGRVPTVEELRVGAPVGVITDNGARECWPDVATRDVLGNHVSVADRDYTIVGVIHDVRLTGFGESYLTSELFVPMVTLAPYYSTFVLHSDGRDSGLVGSVTSILRHEGVERSILSVQWLDDLLSDSVRSERITAFVFIFLSSTSLIVLAAGVFGLVAQKMARRTRELAIRIAIGARPQDLDLMLLGEQGRTVIIGFVAGGILSAWSLRLMGTYARDMPLYSPVVWLTAVGVIAITVFAAVLVPLSRAKRVSPATLLRSE
jgi:predicted permease